MTSHNLLDLLKKKRSLREEEEADIIIHEDIGDVDDIDELEFVEVDEEEGQKIGMEHFRLARPSDFIKTRPNILISVPSNSTSRDSRSHRATPKLRVRPSRRDFPLNHRFSLIQNRIMKRHINPHFAILSVLRKKPSVFTRVGYFCSNSEGMPEGRKETIAARLRKRHGDDFNVEEYWKKQSEFWKKQFKWFDKKNDPIDKAELDRELEEYMAVHYDEDEDYGQGEEEEEEQGEEEDEQEEEKMQDEEMPSLLRNEEEKRYQVRTPFATAMKRLKNMGSFGLKSKKDKEKDDLDGELDDFMKSYQKIKPMISDSDLESDEEDIIIDY